MAHVIQEVNDRTVCATLGGVMDQADREAIERAARTMIALAGKIHVLIMLKDFAGLARGVNWPIWRSTPTTPTTVRRW